MKKARVVLLFVLLLSFLAACFGLAEPIYFEDFGRGKNLEELGFSGPKPLAWFLETKDRYMKGLSPGGMHHAAVVYTPSFAASRRETELVVEWKVNFLTTGHRREDEEELFVGLADARGNVLYRLALSPSHRGREEWFACELRKAGRPHEALLKKVFFKSPLRGWHTFRTVLAPPAGGGGIRLFCDDNKVFSLCDNTYLDFAKLCFAYRAARRHQAVGIDEILVAVKRPPAQDTTPPVTRHDYEHGDAWVNKPVVIHLTATDEGSGVAATYYRINGGPVQGGTEIAITQDGVYEIAYWSVDNAGNTEEAKTVTVKLDATPPVITPTVTPSANPAGWHNAPVSVSFNATDELSGVVEVTPPLTVSAEGAGQRVTGFAVDAAGNRAEVEVTLNLDLTPPVILTLNPSGIWVSATRPEITASFREELSGIAAAKLTLDGEEIKEGFLLTSNTLTYTPPADLTPGRHDLALTLRDRAENEASCSASFVIDPGMPPVPPDPAQVAPPLDRTGFTDMASSTSFLYSGDDPIQKGVLPGTIEPKRAAVIRGRVLTAEGSPLPGATISVLGHPEYGYTISRQDGYFDLAVNGGGPLVLKYERPGYLPAQRQVQVPWQDYAHAPDVVMIKPDPQVTEVRMDASELQVARGSVITDKDGTRQATLLIPAGTKLEGMDLQTLHIRVTEYSVGEQGPLAMPAELPPQVGYTYCVELSADEAEDIRFVRPVYFYVENFLNFPVGTPVPVGYYDREKGIWVPSQNGRVIRIVGINDGLAQIDLDGSGAPASEESFAQLGFTTDERRKLAELYPVGQSLWRVPVTHFTPWDCNWPYGPPAGAEPPGMAMATCDRKEEGSSLCFEKKRSTIEIQNQILGETVGITGTPYTLNYASDRVAGRKAAYTLEIPLSKEQVPPGLKRIDLEIHIAGRVFTDEFPPVPNQSYTFTWDGKDAYGRKLQGEHPAKVRIGYVYDAVYYASPSEFQSSFGRVSGVPITGSRARQEIMLWQEYEAKVGTWEAKDQDLGGWTLEMHHFYDPGGRVVYFGDGSRRSAESISSVMTTVAGTGGAGYSGDGGPAVQARLYYPTDIALGPDGSIYIADPGNNRIRRVTPDGIITTVAGTGAAGYGGDGGPGVQARLYYPTSSALGPDGSIYIADSYNHRIRRVGPDGVITTVAGTGVAGYTGDGGPATGARLSSPTGVALGPDGSIYIADYSNHRIRRIGPDGIITTIAGTGLAGYGGDGGPAIQARLYYPTRIVLGPDGSIYIADSSNHRIRRVGPDGIITTVAGTGVAGYSGDGGPATEARLSSPTGVALGPDGSIYIADYSNHRIRRVGPDGIITTVAGTGAAGYGGDNGPAIGAKLYYCTRITMGPDGSLYIADTYNHRIRRVSPVFPGFTPGEYAIPSEDGSHIYRFDVQGRHLATLDALTGKVLYTFHYNDQGLLVAIEDVDGNITSIERDSFGNPTAIVGPYGQRTTLTLDANGYLASVTNPAGETVRLRYTQDGLLTELIDPRGGVHRFAYDALGRLVRDEDPAGGVLVLERSKTANGYQVKRLARVGADEYEETVYTMEYLSTGEKRMIVQGCCGGPTTTIFGTDGSRTTTYADGTQVKLVLGPDPRFGMQAPIVKEMTVKTPGGLTYTQTATRSSPWPNRVILSVCRP
ncbi:MAG: NHL domain-containing protein [Bacillota bacterium]